MSRAVKTLPTHAVKTRRFLSLPAVVASLDKSMKSNPRRRRGFTLTEILVVITIIITVGALVLLFVSRMRESARKAASIQNLRQFGAAITCFVADNSGYLPASRSSKGVYWPQIIYPYIETVDPYLIPQTPLRPMGAGSPDEGYFPMADKAAMTPEEKPIRWNYTINGGHNKLPFSEVANDGKPMPGLGQGCSRSFSQLTDPGRTVMLAEGTSWWLNASAKPDSDRIRRWNNNTANILWCDGTVSVVNPKTELRQSDFYAVK